MLCAHSPTDAPTTTEAAGIRRYGWLHHLQAVLPALLRVQLKVIPQGGTTGSGFRVLVGACAREVVRGRIAACGSSLTFDKRYCAATPVPGVA